MISSDNLPHLIAAFVLIYIIVDIIKYYFRKNRYKIKCAEYKEKYRGRYRLARHEYDETIYFQVFYSGNGWKNTTMYIQGLNNSLDEFFVDMIDKIIYEENTKGVYTEIN